MGIAFQRGNRFALTAFIMYFVNSFQHSRHNLRTAKIQKNARMTGEIWLNGNLTARACRGKANMYGNRFCQAAGWYPGLPPVAQKGIFL